MSSIHDGKTFRTRTELEERVRELFARALVVNERYTLDVVRAMTGGFEVFVCSNMTIAKLERAATAFYFIAQFNAGEE